MSPWSDDTGQRWRLHLRIPHRHPCTISGCTPGWRCIISDNVVAEVRSNWFELSHVIKLCLFVVNNVYHVGQKTVPFYFCNSFVRASSIKTIFDTRILQEIFYHPYIPHSLYNQRRGTSLSFSSTAGQRTVHAQPSCSFVARHQTLIIAPIIVTF